MRITAVALTDQNNAFGKNHIVLNYLPAYVKFFNELTKDAPLIMGRNTFESIGHIINSRKNIVITRNEKYHSVKARTFHNLSEALAYLENEEKVFVIGGLEIFNEALPLASEVYRTSIRARFKSELFYPEIDTTDFNLESAVCINANEQNRFEYCIEKWMRKGFIGSRLSPAK